MKSISHQNMVNEVGGTSVEQNYDNDEIQEEQTMDAQGLVESKHDIEKVARANVFSEKMIRKLDQVAREFRKNYIYKVDEATRRGYQNPYEPILFAIGPYHRGKSNLQSMEEHKWQCLNGMIKLVMENTGISRLDLIKRCYDLLEGLEDEARGYYAEDIGLDSSDFLDMLLLDGCFLLETIRRKFSDGEDPFINREHIELILNHDVLLLENQIPFFILEKLHVVMVTDDNDGKDSPVLKQLVVQSYILLSVVQAIRPLARATEDYVGTLISISKLYGTSQDIFDGVAAEELKQLMTDIAAREKEREIDPEELKNTKHLLELIHKVLLREDVLEIHVPTSTTLQVVSECESSFLNLINEVRNTHTVTELSNAGVKFKPIDKRKFYDIQFKNSTLEIPRITIVRNTTEGIFRNLMAYELGNDEVKCIINSYLNFMDSIISSEKDVELLRNHGIIEHFLGDDEAVSTMFNQLGAISVRGLAYRYSNINKQLKHHCEKRQNVWMAKLRSDYFSSPWAIISVIAAFVLLVLTIIQTVYSPLSYYKG